MDDFPIEEFKNDFIVKTLVQQTQFENWLRLFFFLNNELSSKDDYIYQDAFYIKLYELLTTGLSYANKALTIMEKGTNKKTSKWYSELIDGLTSIQNLLNEDELEYVEYRRHCVSHIFQDGYEHIQPDLRIKKIKGAKNLQDINASLRRLIIKHGHDKLVDIYLNSILSPKISELHSRLMSIHNSTDG